MVSKLFIRETESGYHCAKSNLFLEGTLGIFFQTPFKSVTRASPEEQEGTCLLDGVCGGGTRGQQGQGRAKATPLVWGSTGVETGVLVEPPENLQAVPRPSPAVTRGPLVAVSVGPVLMLACPQHRHGSGRAFSIIRSRFC